MRKRLKIIKTLPSFTFVFGFRFAFWGMFMSMMLLFSGLKFIIDFFFTVSISWSRIMFWWWRPVKFKIISTKNIKMFLFQTLIRYWGQYYHPYNLTNWLWLHCYQYLHILIKVLTVLFVVDKWKFKTTLIH